LTSRRLEKQRNWLIIFASRGTLSCAWDKLLFQRIDILVQLSQGAHIKWQASCGVDLRFDLRFDFSGKIFHDVL